MVELQFLFGSLWSLVSLSLSCLWAKEKRLCCFTGSKEGAEERNDLGTLTALRDAFSAT